MANVSSKRKLLANYYRVDETGHEVLIGELYRTASGAERLKWRASRKDLPSFFTLRCRNAESLTGGCHVDQ